MSAPTKWFIASRKQNAASAFSPATPNFNPNFVIFAAPTFLAPYLIEGFPRLHDFVYSPWLTANLTLERLPDSRGAEPTWDTVFLDSPTLGYVDATHQSLRTHIDRTVWTFYWALADGTPAQNRQLLLEKDWNYWKEAILHDLERVHSDIRQCVSRIDVMRMGHAMIRPAVGSVFSEERRRLTQPRSDSRLLFANSDLSSISIFEEAQYHGVLAAQTVLERLARPPLARATDCASSTGILSQIFASNLKWTCVLYKGASRRSAMNREERDADSTKTRTNLRRRHAQRFLFQPA